MKLVQLEPDDWQRYRDLRLLALRTDPDAFYSTAESDETLSEKQWRRRLEAASYVVEGNSSDLGLVTTLPYAEDDAEDGDWQLVSMWVAPEGRGQGVGHRLRHRCAHVHARLIANKGNASLLRSRCAHGCAVVPFVPRCPPLGV